MKKNKGQSGQEVNEEVQDLPEVEAVQEPEFTGKEQWGVGGRFTILQNGRRVRKNEKG